MSTAIIPGGVGREPVGIGWFKHLRETHARKLPAVDDGVSQAEWLVPGCSLFLLKERTKTLFKHHPRRPPPPFRSGTDFGKKALGEIDSGLHTPILALYCRQAIPGLLTRAEAPPYLPESGISK